MLVVVSNGFGVQRHSMTAVACSGVWRCATVWLFPLVVVRQAVEEVEEMEMAIYPFGGKPPKARKPFL